MKLYLNNISSSANLSIPNKQKSCLSITRNSVYSMQTTVADRLHFWTSAISPKESPLRMTLTSPLPCLSNALSSSTSTVIPTLPENTKQKPIPKCPLRMMTRRRPNPSYLYVVKRKTNQSKDFVLHNHICTWCFHISPIRVHIWSWRTKKRKQTWSARDGGMQIGIFKVE